mmetsp:Transcript_780/g.1869  ORF Transcript_780/g.1869 Transcript_780/m.1869 type:complete len:175 (-) Transcript_780:108-632(-)|eukprot:CAMPEP_0172456940 /NCGR_PEP_ID=MMETSP1065-20121228/18610_1 /TAXON_ID=265537 /ORGANISM="Amphiprora paludosa, Strain CCMP125" /LENGTH=174 /DNA_ID=CAMNT_0013210283 /DNA_START=116 /DNA_END=640 /DNA_ORIENTATION=+
MTLPQAVVDPSSDFLEDENQPKPVADIENNTGEDAATTDHDDDDDDITVIVLDQTAAENTNNPNRNPNRAQEALAWIDQAGSPELEERRRVVLMRELRRVQRASFVHFCLLCAIPTVLLLVVIATVVGQEEDCASNTTLCELEERNFINAFTTRCVCEAIGYANTATGGDAGGN